MILRIANGLFSFPPSLSTLFGECTNVCICLTRLVSPFRLPQSGPRRGAKVYIRERLSLLQPLFRMLIICTCLFLYYREHPHSKITKLKSDHTLKCDQRNRQNVFQSPQLVSSLSVAESCTRACLHQTRKTGKCTLDVRVDDDEIFLS